MNKSNKFLSFSGTAVLVLLLVPCFFSVLSQTKTTKPESIEFSSDSSCLNQINKYSARKSIAKAALSTLDLKFEDLADKWRCTKFARISIGTGVASLFTTETKQKEIKNCIYDQLFRYHAWQTADAWKNIGWSGNTDWVKSKTGGGGLQPGDLLFQPKISASGHVGIVVQKNGVLMVAENNGYYPPRKISGKKDYRRLIPLSQFGAFESVGRFGGF